MPPLNLVHSVTEREESPPSELIYHNQIAPMIARVQQGLESGKSVATDLNDDEAGEIKNLLRRKATRSTDVHYTDPIGDGVAVCLVREKISNNDSIWKCYVAKGNEKLPSKFIGQEAYLFGAPDVESDPYAGLHRCGDIIEIMNKQGMGDKVKLLDEFVDTSVQIKTNRAKMSKKDLTSLRSRYAELLLQLGPAGRAVEEIIRKTHRS